MRKRFLIFSILGLFVVGAFFGVQEFMELVSRRGGERFGQEALVQRDYTPLELWGEREVSRREISNADITVNSETLTYEDVELRQSGNIIIEGTGKLVFSNSILKMAPGQNDLRANIFVRDDAEIVFENSTLKPNPDDPANLYVNLSGNARFTFKNSQGLHMIIARENARIEITDSTWALSLPNFRGGGMKLGDEVQAHVINSTIGGLMLEFSPDAQIDIKDFRAGRSEDFDLVRDFSPKGVGFNVVMQDSEILTDYLEGGSERGLAIFAPSSIRRLRVSNSTLNKLVIMSANERLEFEGLGVGVEQNFSYRNISLLSSKVMAQWGFFLHRGKARFTDSKGLWFFIHEDTELSLIDSEMNEFDPRNFSGIIEFENVIWKNAGEIIGNNDFTWHGEWMAQGFDLGDLRPLLWDDSRVRREFSLDVARYTPEVMLVRGAAIEVQDTDGALIAESQTDKNGRAYFSIVFDDTNYKSNFFLKVSDGEREAQHIINFLTPTPIKLILK